jgi:hypothetical protein
MAHDAAVEGLHPARSPTAPRPLAAPSLTPPSPRSEGGSSWDLAGAAKSSHRTCLPPGRISHRAPPGNRIRALWSGGRQRSRSRFRASLARSRELRRGASGGPAEGRCLAEGLWCCALPGPGCALWRGQGERESLRNPIVLYIRVLAIGLLG